jgi:hypothetical protein
MVTYFTCNFKENNMTDKQIAWAMTHDWYLYTGKRMTDNVNVVHVKDDMVSGHTLDFDNFEELYFWAGY